MQHSGGERRVDPRRQLDRGIAARDADPAAVDGLLYGAAPADDDALVRLADDLRTLERTLTQEVAGS